MKTCPNNIFRSPERTKELDACVLAILKGMPHLLLPVEWGKTLQLCFSPVALRDGKTDWMMWKKYRRHVFGHLGHLRSRYK